MTHLNLEKSVKNHEKKQVDLTPPIIFSIRLHVACLDHVDFVAGPNLGQAFSCHAELSGAISSFIFISSNHIILAMGTDFLKNQDSDVFLFFFNPE